MLGEDREDEISDADKARAYSSQPVWKRLLIVVSGPVFNLFFAGFIFMFVFLSGVPVLMSEVGEVLVDSPAARAGLLKGDSIVEINNAPVMRWDEMTGIIHKSPGVKLSLKIKRGDDLIALDITPEKTTPNIFGENKVGLIGIKPGKTFIEEGPAFGRIIRCNKDVGPLSLTIVSIEAIQRIIPAETIGGPILYSRWQDSRLLRGH